MLFTRKFTVLHWVFEVNYNAKFSNQVSADKLNLLWIVLLQMSLKRVFYITSKLNF